MISLTEEQRQTYLRDEYLFLQNQYEDYDKRSLTIKGWVTTGAVVALASSFNSKGLLAISIPILVGVIVIIAWILEVYWKIFQYAFTDRIRIIEAYFRNEPDVLIKEPMPFQIYNWWYRSYRYDEPIYEYERQQGLRPKSFTERRREVAFQRFVCLPYLPILVLCAVTAVVLYFGVIHATPGI